MTVAVTVAVLLVALAVLRLLVLHVLSGRNPHQRGGDEAGLRVDEPRARVARAVPEAVAAHPVRAADEEDLLVEVLDHLNAGLHDDERRRDRKADVYVDVDLRVGAARNSGGERDEAGEGE